MSIPKKILIIGGPKTGKTTLANKIKLKTGHSVYHTDDLIGAKSWSDSSEEVCKWIDHKQAPWVIEGVATVRALRKWFRRHPSELPDFFIAILKEKKIKQSTGQSAMAKAIETILAEIKPEIDKRVVVLTEKTLEGMI